MDALIEARKEKGYASEEDNLDEFDPDYFVDK